MSFLKADLGLPGRRCVDGQGLMAKDGIRLFLLCVCHEAWASFSVDGATCCQAAAVLAAATAAGVPCLMVYVSVVYVVASRIVFRGGLKGRIRSEAIAYWIWYDLSFTRKQLRRDRWPNCACTARR